MTSDGTYNYQYDNEGNRTKRTNIATGAVTEYTWDYRDRLIKVTERASAEGAATKVVEYSYDVFDRRVTKDVDSNGDETFETGERYVYDGQQIALQFDRTSALAHRYLSGPAVDQVLADENASGVVRWLLADNEGTIRDVAQYDSGTDQTTVVDHLKYDAFGTITSESNSSAEPHFAYTGRDWDPDVGLYYNRARWYDPKTGRFLSQDPTGFKAGDTNLNRYVWNRPTTLTDPTGGSGGVGGSGGNPPPMPPVPGNGGSDGDYSGAQLNWSASNVTGGDSGEYNVDWDISVSGRSTAMVSLIQLVTASGDLWLGQSTTDPLINYGSGGKFSAPTVCFLEYLGDVPMVNYKAENPDFAKGTFTDQWWEYATDPYTVTPMTVGPNVQPVGPPGTYYVGGDEYTTTTVLALPQKDAQDLTSGWVQRRQHWVFTNPVLKEPIDRWFDTDASLAMPPSTDPSAATDFKLWDELMSHAIASASYAMTASWGGGPSIETYVTAPVPS